MLKFLNSWWFKAFISGVITVIATTHTNYILGWICFVLLFITLPGQSPARSFKTGLLFGLGIAALGFYWMIPGAERFTGNSVFYGIGVFLISSVFFALFFGLVNFCLGVLLIRQDKKNNILINGLLAACVYSIFEALLMFVSAGFPWFDYHTGYALMANLYFIQPAAFFGISIISFIIILVNYLVAGFIMQKQWIKLLIPVGVIVVYFFCGYFMFSAISLDESLLKTKPITVAILSENIPPEVRWNDTTGNMLAGRLLDMNRTAITLRPDIALWSESAIPWTYKPNDDLVDSVVKITSPAHITHIMGINTEVANNVVYNSAYCILPNGKVAGRYDKQVLLSLIEKPLGGKLIPFFSSNGFSAETDGYGEPLNTPYGKAGVMICNESAVPSAAYNPVKKGAQFIMNMSNDGWFSDTYIVGLHFYNARLRAVETRKDIVVNSNNGISGLIQASGQIASAKQSTEAYVDSVTVHPNEWHTMAVEYPNLFVYCCCGLLVLIVVFKFTRKPAISN